MHQSGTPIWRPIQSSTKVRETFRQGELRNCGPQRPETWKIVYILVSYNNSFSWLLPLDSFQYIFLLRDSENDLQELKVQRLSCESLNS